MSSEMETRSREGGALATALAAEQALQAEESMLLQRAADLEKQVREHKLRKEAAALAKQQAEEQRKAEEELEKWAQELKAEVDKTIERLNAQRATQIARCQQFDATLQANIEAMQQMQMQVRRRQAALDAAFDAAAAKVANAHHDAVLTRRRQAAAEATQRASDAAGKAAALPPLPPLPPMSRATAIGTLPPGAAALSHELLASVDQRHLPPRAAAAASSSSQRPQPTVDSLSSPPR